MNTLTASLYESDFYGWTQHQADALRSKNIAALDFDNLLEEMEAMGRGEKRSLKSRLSVILAHLLKWQYQPERRGKSWELTIAEQRDQAKDILDENLSLKPLIPEYMEKAWKAAKRKAGREASITQSTFPAQCPWSFEEVMDDEFWPD